MVSYSWDSIQRRPTVRDVQITADLVEIGTIQVAGDVLAMQVVDQEDQAGLLRVVSPIDHTLLVLEGCQTLRICMALLI